jgi:hypothetical protein
MNLHTNPPSAASGFARWPQPKVIHFPSFGDKTGAQETLVISLASRTFMVFPSSRRGSGRHRPRQSLRLVAWPVQALRWWLPPFAPPASFFASPMVSRGQGKEKVFFQKPIEKGAEQSRVASFKLIGSS